MQWPGSEEKARRAPFYAIGSSTLASDLEREIKELRTVNEILKKGEPVKAVVHRGAIGSSPMDDGSSPLANACFAQAELDRIRRESRPPEAFPILLIASEGLNAIGSTDGPNAVIEEHREVHGG